MNKEFQSQRSLLGFKLHMSHFLFFRYFRTSDFIHTMSLRTATAQGRISTLVRWLSTAPLQVRSFDHLRLVPRFYQKEPGMLHHSVLLISRSLGL